MRIAILTLGSRGDVQPYVALARGLEAAGYSAAVLAAPMFRSFVESHGVEWRSFDTGDPRALLQSQEARDLIRGMANPVRMVRELMKLIEPLIEKGYTEAWQNTEDADAILVAPTVLPLADALRERRGTPFACAFLQPSHRTSEFGCWILGDTPQWLPFRGALNRLTYSFGWKVLYRVAGRAYDTARQRVLGLPPGKNPFGQLEVENWPTIYGYSSTVAPRASDWGPHVDVTGYWFLDRDSRWRPPAGLEEFLADGPPPICVGFGSMPSPDPAALTREVVRAIELSGHRGLLLSGWGALADVELPKSVYAVESAPHDWLFSRVCAVVHHGGAGTTSATLRAGVPSLVVPFIADQWFWGRRIAALGAGPGLFSRKRITAERFGPALRELAENPRYREAARAVSAKLALENGIGRAVAALPF
jgi:UDP:flavonoid glycosyltransferase YjiC (YdhE family)